MTASTPSSCIKKFTVSLVLGAMLVTTVGCAERSIRAGGTRSVRAGKTHNMAVYGVGAKKRLEFLIITDIPSNETMASAGSTWEGRIVPKQGMALDYRVIDDELMTISGTENRLENGRVFLVSTKDGRVAVRQVTLTNVHMSYDTEINRIIATEEVQEFLNPTTDEPAED